MRMPVYYLMCATVMAMVSGDERSNNNFFEERRLLEPLDVAADQETVSYLLPRLTAKYKPSSEWTTVTDPRFYLLTEADTNDYDNQVRARRKIQRRSPSISIVAPIEVLRKSWEKERARKQIMRNRQYLNNLN